MSTQAYQDAKDTTRCAEQPFDLFGDSDVGRKRDHNEDHYLIADLKRMLLIRESNVPHDQCQQLCSDRTGQLLVVADGMGGHSGGDLASTVAIESSARYVLDMLHWFLKLNNAHEEDFMDDLSNCLRAIQQRIWSKSGGQYHRMGTTVTMAYLLWPQLYVVHAGDSRCYVMKDGILRQMTTDHTIAQQMVDSGAITSEDAGSSRWRHVLWNCVGGGDKVVRPEVSRIELSRGDQVLLCSDGLTDMVDDNAITSILSSADTSQMAVAELIKAANAAGGADNITAVVGRFPDSESSEEALEKDRDAFGSTLRDTDLDHLDKTANK